MTRVLIASILFGTAWLPSMLVGGCDGPSTPALIKDEPTCKDQKIAGIAVKGGLKQPVRLKILDGDEVVVTVMLYGIPESSPQPTRFLLPDANEKYKLEWAQCPNERALTPFDPRDKAASKGSTYDCGDAKVYANPDHEIKRGDPSTHDLVMPPPPVTDCWTSLASTASSGAPSAAPSATPSASAAP